MILIDNILFKRQKENNPIKIALVGTGIMGKGIINQISKYTPGIEIVAIFNRTLNKAIYALEDLGIKNYDIVDSNKKYEKVRQQKKICLTEDINVLCEGYDIDLIIEVTGTLEFAANLILLAFKNKKHILSFNAEIDATLGPILQYIAKQAGVRYSVSEGDQPGVTMNLYRQVKLMGFNPLICGNIKGLQDKYRNPTTQKSFAAQWDMSPSMVTSFADGTKISIEQACIANATGMKVAKRGMLGYYTNKHIDEIKDLYDLESITKIGGIVDYVVGAKPGPGVFIFATIDDHFSRKYLKYVKMGEGPLYSFYVPYHLLFFEIANSITRMIDFNDIILDAKGCTVDVITIAKTNLKKGERIDGLGGYAIYGECENHEIAKEQNLLPIGLAEDCTLLRDVLKDEPLTFRDVQLPEGRIIDALWNEQQDLFH